MASPQENTQLIRMLRDFKDAIYKSGPPSEFDSPALMRGFRRPRSAALNLTSVAAKLNFSNIGETTIGSSSNAGDDKITQTPEQLKRKLDHAEIELQASKAALKEKEAALTMMEPANKKLCLSLEQKLEQTRQRNEVDQGKITQLETQLKHVQNELAFAKSEASEYEKEKRIACNKLDMKLLAVQQECSNLRLTISEMKSEKAETCGKLNNEISQLKLKLSTLKDEYTTSKSVIASLKKQIAELTDKATSAISLQEELCASQSRIKELENTIAANEDAALVVQSMQSELKALPELHKENRRLKDELSKYKESNVSLFQEKMWAYQEKLAQAEKKNLAMAKLQVENETLKNKLAEWESLYDDQSSPTVKSPTAFSRRLSKYQKNEMIMTNKVASLTTYCDSLEKKNKVLETTIEQLKKSGDQVNRSSSGYESLVRRLQRKVFLLTKERDNCRKLIDSYVSETTLSGAVLNSLHVKNLEDTIADYKKSLEQADKDIENFEEQVKALSECKKSLAEEKLLVKQLQEENAQLLSTIKEMRSSQESLQSKFAEEYEESSTKKERIIHLKLNPLDEAINKKAMDLKSLQDENDKLRKRVKVLEEGGAGVCDVTAKVEEKLEAEGSETMLKSLKEQLAAAEKQNKLIIETARSSVNDFRTAVYTLTGYRFDAPSTGKYKLSSVYANSRDDFLLFEVNDDGVQLLETEFSGQLSGLIEMYLQTYDSVPAFLAAVTMDLFKQQTCMVTQ